MARRGGFAVGAAVLSVGALGLAACTGSPSEDASTTLAPQTPAPLTSTQSPETETTGPDAGPFDPARCAPEALVGDLDVPEEYAGAAVEVAECVEPGWAVVRWDVPGDSQRIARLVDGVWVQYVAFPHDVCRTQARTEGVPEELEVYFLGC